MSTFDDSPRTTKRRKTDPYSSPNLPLASRAFRVVKEAVFGKSPLRSSPRSRNGTGSHGHATPVQSSKQADNEKLEENVDWDVPDSDDDGPRSSTRPSTQTRARRDSSNVQDNGPKSTPTNRRNGRKGHGVDGSVGDGPKSLATPTKTRKGSHRPRSELHDRDELGSDTVEEEIKKTAKRVDDGVNSRKNLRGRQQWQESEKAAGGKNSRASATLNDLNGSSGHLYVVKPGHSHKKQRKESDGLAVEADEVIRVVPTPPTARLGWKRGLEEVHKTDDVPVDISPTTPSRRKRGRPRKPTSLAAVTHNVQDDDLTFKSIPSRHGSVDPLLNRTKSDSYIAPIDEISSPTIARRTPGRKYRKAAEVTPDTSIPTQGAPTKDAVGNDLEINNEDSVKDHVTEFRNFLERHTTGSVTALKRLVMDGLTGKRRLPLVSLEEEYQKVRQLVEQTVLAGEGNSMLLVGSRGTAKTMLVETVIEELAIDHREEFYVVRLNGFIHTDDKLALREIWRQLGREMEIEDEAVGERSNYADTLTSLLALLSHSSEMSQTEHGHIAKSVIFVIDEFDLFASHPRQTLLYNLFDVAQSRNPPIAVLGLTTKVDIVDSLEKRVKSRFSQRYIHLSLPRSYVLFQGICRSALASRNATLAARLKYGDTDLQKLHTAWTQYVDALFTEDSAFDTFLVKIYTRTKSVPSFLTACLLPISLLSASHIPTGLDFASQSLFAPDSKLHLLPGLSDLELSLLIGAARLDIILDTDMCNFNMAYDEYQQLASRVKAQSSAAGQTAVGGGARVWGREVASGAWERLAKLELILPAMGGSGKGEVGRANGRMWRVDVGLEEIGPSVSGMNGVMAKWCREI